MYVGLTYKGCHMKQNIHSVTLITEQHNEKATKKDNKREPNSWDWKLYLLLACCALVATGYIVGVAIGLIPPVSGLTIFM